jgi:hypothetical protein
VYSYLSAFPYATLPDVDYSKCEGGGYGEPHGGMIEYGPDPCAADIHEDYTECGCVKTVSATLLRRFSGKT